MRVSTAVFGSGGRDARSDGERVIDLTQSYR